jgi:hypothetical protein
MSLGRSIPPRRGYLPSITAGKSVPYEGPLKLDFLYVIDADRRVTGLRANVRTITYVDDGVTHEYTPAYIVTRGNREVLIDCVPAARKEGKVMQRRIAAAHEWCEEQGYDFEVFTEKDLPSSYHLANIKHLHRYNQHQVEPDFQARVYGVLDKFPEGVTIQELAERLAGPEGDVHQAVDGICSMACHKAIALSIATAPISVDTRAYLPNFLN